MATDNDPPAKRQKLTAGDCISSAPMFGPPKMHSVIALYNPEMVEITVSNQSLDNPLKVTFKIPKALISSRSEHFNGVLHDCVVDGGESTVELQDVNPRTFRCFVGWLYCHRIFLDEIDRAGLESISARKHEQKDQSGAMDTVATGAESAVNELSGGGGQAQSATTEPGEVSATLEVHRARQGNLPTSGPAPPIAGEQHGQATMAERHTATPGTSSKDWKDAITWPWMWLFQLYVFADKYSARDFRMEILTTIQTKFYANFPRSYRVPSLVEITYAVENLTTSSPLFRFLVDVHGLLFVEGKKSIDSSEQANFLVRLPPSFLAACIVALKRHHFALSCPECATRSPHQTLRGHAPEDSKPVRERDPCIYHEHGDDGEEAARCAAVWEARKSLVSRNS